MLSCRKKNASQMHVAPVLVVLASNTILWILNGTVSHAYCLHTTFLALPAVETHLFTCTEDTQLTLFEEEQPAYVTVNPATTTESQQTIIWTPEHYILYMVPYQLYITVQMGGMATGRVYIVSTCNIICCVVLLDRAGKRGKRCGVSAVLKDAMFKHSMCRVQVCPRCRCCSSAAQGTEPVKKPYAYDL